MASKQVSEGSSEQAVRQVDTVCGIRFILASQQKQRKGNTQSRNKPSRYYYSFCFGHQEDDDDHINGGHCSKQGRNSLGESYTKVLTSSSSPFT